MTFTRGSTIAGYRIVERLGTSVFQVEDRRGHSYALRILPEASSELIGRCFTEACASSAIDHAAIARTVDVGIQDGRGFIVTELVDCESLARLLARVRNAPLSTVEALRIARRIAAVLVFAHDRGLAHGGLDPDVIFVDDDGVSITGFGLAALGGGDPMACITGIPLPVYMSPEQCRASVAYDPRSDMYQLGCILYALLTGHPPFRSQRIAELVTSHLMAEPPPLPASIPSAVRNLVAALLAKNPDDRPDALVTMHTLAGLVDELELTAIPRAPWRWLAAAVVAVFLIIPGTYKNLSEKAPDLFHTFDVASLSP